MSSREGVGVRETGRSEMGTGPTRSHDRWMGCLAALCALLVVDSGCAARQDDLATPPPEAPVADVVSVQVTGDPQAYTFSVGISSPDEGCKLYADWWEVLTEDGRLLYRRILTHSHVDEQPFVRSGGPVDIGPDAVVWIRAHMHGGRYGGQAMKGTARSGFEAFDLDPGFASEVEDVAPLPAGCAF